MTLREKLALAIRDAAARQPPKGSTWDQAAADAILAALREHMTSPEAVERAMRTRARVMWERPDTFRVRFGDCEEATRAAILAALGEE